MARDKFGFSIGKGWYYFSIYFVHFSHTVAEIESGWSENGWYLDLVTGRPKWGLRIDKRLTSK